MQGSGGAPQTLDAESAAHLCDRYRLELLPRRATGRDERQSRPDSRCLICTLLAMFLCIYAEVASSASKVVVVFDFERKAHQTVFNDFRDMAIGRAPPDHSLQIEGLDTRELRSGESVGTDLVITIGTRAAEALHNYPVNVPVLNVFLPRAAYLQLAAADQSRPAAVFLDQPIERQFALARALLPEARWVGMLHSPMAAADATAMVQSASRFGLALDIVSIEDDADSADAIEQVLATNDIVISVFDRNAYRPATAKWLIYLALHRRRPIIGFSYALLRAGAIAAVFSTPKDIAAHTADIVAEWLRSGIVPTAAVFPRYYHIGVNGPVAGKLGIDTPSDIALEQQVRTMLEKPQ